MTTLQEYKLQNKFFKKVEEAEHLLGLAKLAANKGSFERADRFIYSAIKELCK